MDQRKIEQGYEGLSPFELKNTFIRMATSDHERMMLNAGRGNPNWLADEPRRAFHQLGLFALSEAKRALDKPGLAGAPDKPGSARRFRSFLESLGDQAGGRFLADCLALAVQDLGLDEEDFVFELVDGVLGDHYPTPDRIPSGGTRGWADRHRNSGPS